MALPGAGLAAYGQVSLPFLGLPFMALVGCHSSKHHVLP